MGKGMGLSRRTPLLATAALITTFFAFGATANARTDVGQIVDPNGSACNQNLTWLQTVSPNNRYVIPENGVITQWTFLGGNVIPTQMKLKVARSAGGNSYLITGESAPEAPVASTLNTFSTQIAVQAGDIIGFHFLGPNFTRCALPGSPGHQDSFAPGDLAPGSTAVFSNEAGQLDIAAVLEPDCDNDTLGDETQDNDLGPCPPAPTATITKGPKSKTKKKTATFEFSANESGATFDCVLDGKQEFKTCTSPLTVKVKKGKHTLSVTATDAGGNKGPTATRDWKVKKKKKKK